MRSRVPRSIKYIVTLLATLPFFIRSGQTATDLEQKLQQADDSATVTIHVSDKKTNEDLQGANVWMRDNGHSYNDSTDEYGDVTFEDVVYTCVAFNDRVIPSGYKLAQNYPNPFNPGTTIEFGLKRATGVDVYVLNVLGQTVKHLVNEKLGSGWYRAEWDGTNENGMEVAAGEYLVRMRTQDGFEKVIKMIKKDGGGRGNSRFSRVGEYVETEAGNVSISKTNQEKAYDITISKDGYVTLDTTATIAGGLNQFEYQLSAEQAETVVHGLITSMFDSTSKGLEGAIVQIGAEKDTTDSTGAYSIPWLEPGNYTMNITMEPDYTARIKIVKVQEGENYENESIVPSDFDWDFFNECAGRNQYKGTQRWMDVPKLYIIDGPLAGYSGFETPTQEEINQIISTWKNEIKKLSNGFIDIPDSNIYIGHDVDDPTFKEAVKQIIDGNVNYNDGWNVLLWTNNLPGSGDHGERVVDGVIVGARQRYRPGASKGIIEIESSQSIGFPVDPADDSKRWKPGHMENGFTDLYYKCGELNYSRPPNTMSPDTSY